jgi:UDPglucose 6-dehydrogenase
MLEKIKGLLGGLSGKAIGALGVTFKPNTDDIRDSPAARIIEELVAGGAAVKLYDPAGMDNARGELSGGITYCSDPYEVADGSDALLILTEWNQFRKLDMGRIKKLLKSPKIADLRNVYDPEGMRALGFEYVSVGR